MATTCSTPEKEKASLPPKRGQIKAQIFNSLVKFMVSTVSKAGKVTGNGDNGGASASSTPPPSAYNSEGNPDVS